MPEVKQIDFLSSYWGMPIGAIVGDWPTGELSGGLVYPIAVGLLRDAQNMGLVFVSANVPASNLDAIRSLERAGFYYAEGFIPMVKYMGEKEPLPYIKNMEIREAIAEDGGEVEAAYRLARFPSRLVNDPGFDTEKARMLYVNRFHEVFESGKGKIFVAETDGQFAGAIIAIIDFKTNTNPPSGMGLIVHPRAHRKGVATALVSYRQWWYYQLGVRHVSFGANINNQPMINCLIKLGFQMGQPAITLHRWLIER